MAVELSSLAIEVKSTGIKEVSNELGGLSRRAGSAEASVKKFTDQVASSVVVQDSSTKKTKEQDAAIEILSKTSKLAAQALGELSAANNLWKSSITGTSRFAQAFVAELGMLEKSYDRLSRSVKMANGGLATQGTTKGLATGLHQIGSIANSAAKGVEILTNNIATMIVNMSSADTKAAKLAAAVGTLKTALSDAKTPMADFNAESRALIAAMGNINAVAGQLQQNMTKTATAYQTLGGAAQNASHSHYQLNGITGMFAKTIGYMLMGGLIYGTANAIKSLATSAVEASDGWAIMQARLKNATGTMEESLRVQGEMYRMAQNIRVPIEDAAKLYTRMVVPMSRMGYTASDAKGMVEGLSLALQLNGSKGAEASSAMLQFSQAISAGRLNGEELNTMLENAPPLVRAIEDELRRTTDWSEKTGKSIKKMGADGELGIELINNAIKNALPKWRQEFEELPLTVNASMTLVSNAFMKLMGESSTIKSLVEELSSTLKGAAYWMDEFGKAIDNASGAAKRAKQEDGLKWYQWMLGSLASTANIAERSLAAVFSIAAAGWKQAGQSYAEGKTPGVQWLEAARAMGATHEQYAAEIRGIAGVTSAVDKRLKTEAAVSKLLSERDQNMDGLDRRLAATKPEVDTLAGAPSLDTVRKYTTTRNSILTEGNEKMVKIAMAFQKSMRETLDPQRKLDLEREMNERLISEQAETQRALKSLEKRENPVDQSAITYKQVVAALEAKNAQLKLGVELTRELYPAEKEIQELNKRAGDYKAVKSDEQYKYVRSLLDTRLQMEMLSTADQQRIKDEKTFADTLANTIKKSSEEADALAEKAGALDRMSISMANARSALERTTLEIIRGQDRGYDVSGLQLLQKEQQRVVDGYEAIAKQDLYKQFDKLFDPQKVKTFGDVMKDTFGEIGKGFAMAIEGMKRYEVSMKRVNEAKKLAAKYDEKNDPLMAEYLLQKAKEETTKAEVTGYADMAGAAKSFFDEKSKAYKALEAVERTFRAAQMAMQLQSFLQESGFITAITSLFVTSKATETTAEIASVGPHVAAEGTKQGANAVTALTSALAAPFPANIPAFAAVAALLAAIGVAVKGSSGAAPTQKAGAGSVFGDVKDEHGNYGQVSESIANSLEILSDVDSMTMRYSAQMAASLRSIEANIAGVTNLVIRGSGENISTGGSSVAMSSANPMYGAAHLGVQVAKGFEQALGPLGNVIGGVLRKDAQIIAKLFGTKTSVTGSGILAAEQNLGSVLENGFQGNYYNDVLKKKKFFGATYSKSNGTQVGATIDGELARQFSLILTGFADSVSLAGDALGMNLSVISNKIDSFPVVIGKLDLMNLSGEQIEEKLTAVFNKTADDLAKAVLPGLEDFQQVGEGYFETVVRVASATEQANIALEMLGVSAVAYTDVLNKQGDISAEIVRLSLLAKEGTSGVAEILESFADSADELIDAYKSLIQVRKEMKRVGFNTDLNRDLIIAGGGLDVLSESLQSYFDNFFTDSEKLAAKTKEVQDEFAKLGMAMPASTTAYRALVESLLGSGKVDTAARVLGLSDAFAELFEDVGSYDDLLSDAKDVLRDAYERESDALQGVIDKFKDFSKSLKDFSISLMTGDKSPLTPLEQYQQAMGQYSSTYAKAMSGDESAISDFQGVAEKFLELSRTMYASGAAYNADFYKVLEQTQALEEMTNGKASLAEQQLEQLKSQVGALIDIDETTKTVAQAIYDLQYLIANGKMPTETDGSHANGLSYVPFDGYVAELHQGERVLTAAENKAYSVDYSQYGRNSGNEALVAEIKALRQEVSSLRSDQAQQTNALIGANYDANERNAQTVVQGQKEAAKDAEYGNRVKGTLV